MSMGAMSQVKETPVEGLKWKGNGADFLTINGLQNQLRRLTMRWQGFWVKIMFPRFPQIRPSRIAHLSFSNHNHSRWPREYVYTNTRRLRPFFNIYFFAQSSRMTPYSSDSPELRLHIRNLLYNYSILHYTTNHLTFTEELASEVRTTMEPLISSLTLRWLFSSSRTWSRFHSPIRIRSLGLLIPSMPFLNFTE